MDGQVILVGDDRLLHKEAVAHKDCEADGTVAYVAVNGDYAGYLVVSDEVKEEGFESVQKLRSSGIREIVMLTGDDRRIAARIARMAGITEYYAELLPENKVQRIEELKRRLPAGQKLAFVGDGINDAPVLMQADVGIAMGALGSDAAVEAADVVLMDDRLSRIPLALRIARFIRRIVIQNIALALCVKLAFVALGSIGAATMWEAVIGDMGVSLLAVLNATRTLRTPGLRAK